MKRGEGSFAAFAAPTVYDLTARFPEYKYLTNEERAVAGGPAKRRINITELRDVRAWTNQLNCARDELMAAVSAVGNIVSDVANYLKIK